jgi:hypothetical protein
MRRDKRPTYVRMLRLRRLHPPGWLSFVLLEGSVLFGVLLALSELVGWQVGVAVPFAVAAVVKVTDLVLVARTESPSTGTGSVVMRPSVAAIRAQQRAGAAARPSTVARAVADGPASTPHAPSLAPSLAARERNRRVARGVAAVPTSARLRPRLTRGGSARVVGAWPMPVGSPIEVTGVVVDGTAIEGSAGAHAAWQGPTVGITTEPARQPKAGQRADRVRGRNQGRFAARR